LPCFFYCMQDWFVAITCCSFKTSPKRRMVVMALNFSACCNVGLMWHTFDLLKTQSQGSCYRCSVHTSEFKYIGFSILFVPFGLVWLSGMGFNFHLSSAICRSWAIEFSFKFKIIFASLVLFLVFLGLQIVFFCIKV
jgi:hypothetical protein